MRPELELSIGKPMLDSVGTKIWCNVDITL